MRLVQGLRKPGVRPACRRVRDVYDLGAVLLAARLRRRDVPDLPVIRGNRAFVVIVVGSSAGETKALPDLGAAVSASSR